LSSGCGLNLEQIENNIKAPEVEDSAAAANCGSGAEKADSRKKGSTVILRS